MIEVKLFTTDKKQSVTLNLPEKVSEVKLRHFTEFERAHERKEAIWGKYVKNEMPYQEWLLQYVKAVLDCIRALNIGKVDDIAFGNLREHLKVVYQGSAEGMQKSEQTVLTLLAHFYKVIGQYNMKDRKLDWSKDYEFSYRGEKYVINGGHTDALTKTQRFYPHSLAQLVESLEIHRHYEKHRNQDPHGNFLFTTILHMVSCYALKPDQQFPDNDVDIERFISDRVVYFQDLPVDVGLDIYNFFLLSLQHSKTTPDTNTFGSHRKRWGRNRRRV